MKNIVFDRSVWSLVDMNVNITSCDVHSMQIILHKKTSMNNISVHITGSQIGSNIEMYAANATLDNCSMVHSKLPPEGPTISAVNSTVSVKSSYFENVDGRAFLWVTSGLAHLTDVIFFKHFHPVDSLNQVMSLIRVMNESQMSVKNCTFTQIEGQCLEVHNSTVIIRNSTFENNTDYHNISHDPWIGYPLVFISNSFLVLRNSHFLNNKYPAAAPIYFQNGSFGCLEDSDFRNNVIGQEAAVISLSSKVKVNRCRFLNNKGRAFFAFNNSVISMSTCLQQIHSKREFLSGAEGDQTNSSSETMDTVQTNRTDGNETTHLCSKPDTIICNCMFAGNTAAFGAAIFAQDVSLLLQSNHFLNNSAVGSLNNSDHGAGGAVWFSSNGNNSIHIFDSSFVENQASRYSGAIYSHSQTITIQGCRFIGNRAQAGGAIHLMSTPFGNTETSLWNTTIIVSNCMFIGNIADGVYGDAPCCLDGHVINRLAGLPKGLGGAIVFDCGPNANSFLQVSNSVFKQNSASSAGGAILTMFTSKNEALNFSSGPFSVSPTNNTETYLKSETTIWNCIFGGNTAEQGGAIWADDVSLTVQNSHFLKNSAVQQTQTIRGLGGAITHKQKNNTCLVQISNSSFMQNYAAHYGGAIVVGHYEISEDRAMGAESLTSVNTANFSSVQHNTVRNCTFVGNTAESGGAIIAANVSLVLQHNHFENNKAEHDNKTRGSFFFTNMSLVWQRKGVDLLIFSIDSGVGGAVCQQSNQHYFLQISNSSFKQNKASLDGGAVKTQSPVHIHSSKFVANSAWYSGGAIFSSWTVNITDSHFELNSADLGGAIRSQGPEANTNISFTKFIHNLGIGGAVAQTYGSFSCTWCIFLNNTAR